MTTKNDTPTQPLKARIGFACWLDRVNMLLAVAGYRESDFGTVDFRLLYEGGLRPLAIALQLLEDAVSA